MWYLRRNIGERYFARRSSKDLANVMRVEENNKRRGVLGLCTYACRDSIERKYDQLYRLPGYEKYAEWKYKYRKYSSDRNAIQFVGDGHFNMSLLQINEPRCFSTADIMWV